MCGKENDMKKLNVVRLGLLFAGCFLGAGYVSGQELRQYFVVYGAWGYQYLREAIMIAVNDMDVINAITKVLYPQVAKTFSTTPSRRCIWS